MARNAFVILYYVLLLSFACVLQSDGNETGDGDQTRLHQFFQRLEQNSSVLSRKVQLRAGDDAVSVQDYLKSSPRPDGSADLRSMIDGGKTVPIELLNLINVVVSCEYSDIAYNNVELVDTLVSDCTVKLNNRNDVEKSRKLNNCLRKYDAWTLDASPMLLTLASLAGFNRNSVSGNDQVLRILLVWHAFADDYRRKLGGERDLTAKQTIIDSVGLTSYQIVNRLERFMVAHCYGPEALKKFKEDAESRKLNVAIGDVDRKEYFSDIQEKLSTLTISVSTEFVLIPSENDARDVLRLLANETSSETLQISWEGGGDAADATDVYKTAVKNTGNVVTMLKFEKWLLDAVHGIVAGYVANGLRTILDDEAERDKHLRCKSELIDKMQRFAAVLKRDGQPLRLVHITTALQTTLWYYCSLMKFQDAYVKRLIDQFDALRPPGFNGADFDRFLNSLSQKAICARLHPVVSNTFWREDDAYSFAVSFEYAVAYHQSLLITEYNAGCSYRLCKKVSQTAKSVDEMERRINACPAATAVDEIDTCLKRFLEVYDAVKIGITRIIASSTEWEKDPLWNVLLLTVVYNAENVELFDKNEFPSFQPEQIRQLVTFTQIVKLMFKEIEHIDCSRGVRTPAAAEDDDSDNVAELFGVSEQAKRFRISGEIAEKLSFRLQEFSDIRLPWGGGDGAAMTLRQAHDEYRRRAIHVRDGYDFHNFLTRWTVTMLYSVLQDLADETIRINYRLTDEEKNELLTRHNRWMRSERFKREPVGNLFAMLVIVIRHSVGVKYNSSEFRQLIRDELEFVGIRQQSLNRTGGAGTISDRINTLFSYMEQFFEIFRIH